MVQIHPSVPSIFNDFRQAVASRGSIKGSISGLNRGLKSQRVGLDDPADLSCVSYMTVYP